MFKSFSSEYASALALLLVSILKVFKIDITQSELEPAIVAVVSLISVGNLLVKRYKEGGITPLGIRK